MEKKLEKGFEFERKKVTKGFNFKGKTLFRFKNC
jgi:hypothetical protein